MTDTTETEATQTPEQLLVDLAELHMRTHVSPLPKHPAALGWQMTTGAMAAGFARALHALAEVAPEKAAEVTDWFQGPFGEGPDAEEHTDWTARHVAKSAAVVEQWAAEARQLAVQAKEATEAQEKEQQDGKVAALQSQVESVRAFATSHEYRWLHELLDGVGTHGGHL